MPLGRLSLTSENLALFNFYTGGFMKQKFYLHIEEGVAQYENLEQAMRVKSILNSKGIKCRVRMRTPIKAVK